MFELIRSTGFGALITFSRRGLAASHLPFVIDESRGEFGMLFAHMARANPESATLSSDPDVLVTFVGPHAYISPSWYEDRATAPTWNYVAVHCAGRVRVHSDTEAEENMRRLVGVMEKGNERPWSLADLSEHQMRGLLRNIVSFEISIARMDGKFKLSQGETPERNRAAVNQLEQEGREDLAAWMRQYNKL